MTDAVLGCLCALVGVDALYRQDYFFAAFAFVIAVALVWPRSLLPRPVRVALGAAVVVAAAVVVVALATQELIDPASLHVPKPAAIAVGAVTIGGAVAYLAAVTRALLRRRSENIRGD